MTESAIDVGGAGLRRTAGVVIAVSYVAQTLSRKQLQSLHRLVGCLRLKSCLTLLASARAIYISSELRQRFLDGAEYVRFFGFGPKSSLTVIGHK